MENEKPKFTPNPKSKLMDQVREVLRYHHYAYRTEGTYCQWILRYIYFYGGKTHPKELNYKHIERFLSHLANEGKVSVSTQRQALNALVFLYRNVLLLPLEDKIAHVRSKRTARPPTVLTKDEAAKVLKKLEGTHALMAKLLYGCGLRLMECIRLRVKDVDFGQNRIFVRGGKGGKDRTTILPKNIRAELGFHIDKVVSLHQQDLAEGFGEVYLPAALGLKYPKAKMESCWQYVFPTKNRSIDPRSGNQRRHHVQESGLQKTVKRAALLAGIRKQVGCHTLRHS